VLLRGHPFKITALKKAALFLVFLCFLAPCSGHGSQKSGERHPLGLAQALVLGLVEGITEYLPVSSTGHLLLAQHLMGLADTQENKHTADSYAVVIQIGAILAVLGLYRQRSMQILRGIFGKSPEGLKLGLMLILAFAPAALTAFTLEGFIKQHLFGPWAVAVGWIFGGIAIFYLPVNPGTLQPEKTLPLEAINARVALIIGLFQILALWPGISRSLATILGGVFAGLSLGAAVEFSFLLGLITLGAATVYEWINHGSGILAAYGILTPLVGILSAFIAAWVSVKWLVNHLKKHGLGLFGYYRVALGLITILLLLTHRI
jgi:undecaprenyl-diphosphatase